MMVKESNIKSKLKMLSMFKRLILFQGLVEGVFINKVKAWVKVKSLECDNRS